MIKIKQNKYFFFPSLDSISSLSPIQSKAKIDFDLDSIVFNNSHLNKLTIKPTFHKLKDKLRWSKSVSVVSPTRRSITRSVSQKITQIHPQAQKRFFTNVPRGI